MVVELPFEKIVVGSRHSEMVKVGRTSVIVVMLDAADAAEQHTEKTAKLENDFIVKVYRGS